MPHADTIISSDKIVQTVVCNLISALTWCFYFEKTHQRGRDSSSASGCRELFCRLLIRALYLCFHILFYFIFHKLNCQRFN